MLRLLGLWRSFQSQFSSLIQENSTTRSDNLLFNPRSPDGGFACPGKIKLFQVCFLSLDYTCLASYCAADVCRVLIHYRLSDLLL